MPAVSTERREVVHDTLVKAYNSLRFGEWTKGTWRGCIISHINWTVGVPLNACHHPITHWCAVACGFTTVDDAVRWNDSEATSKREVLARLQQGIEATATAPSVPEQRELVLA